MILFIVPFLISIFVVSWIHPKVVRIAKEKGIVDNPDARKLQKVPIPILGGVAVYFGEMVAIAAMSVFVDLSSLLPVIIAMVIMLYIGVMDDILNLSFRLRFLIEFLIVIFLIYAGGFIIDDLGNLLGINHLPRIVAIVLTVVATIGIINAINLIDGVNGLSSGFGILSCTIFAISFIINDNAPMAILALITSGALIPFFLHNVFGKRSRMFIGDGGALTLGLVLSIFVMSALNQNTSSCGSIPFVLAVLAVPVFDTIRVMFTRIIKGKSPFYPDKTHLHHLFISLGYSHILTTAVELLLSIIILFAWWLSYVLGASVDWQFVVVLVVSSLSTFGVYRFVSKRIISKDKLYNKLRKFGKVRILSRATLTCLKIRKSLERFSYKDI